MPSLHLRRWLPAGGLLLCMVGCGAGLRPSAGPAGAPTPFPVPAWEDRTLGPHQVPALFQRTSRDRFVAGPALDAFTVHRLGLPDAFLGDRFLAPSLEGLSAEHLAAVLRGTHDSVWVAGVTALDASVLPPPRSDAGLAVSLPDLTGLSDADLQQLDQRTHTLMLDGLPSLSARQVALLGSAEPARGTGRGEAPPDALLSLRGVRGLTPADLAALASANRSLWLLLHSDLRRTTRVRRFVDFIAAETRQIAPQLRGQLPRHG